MCLLNSSVTISRFRIFSCWMILLFAAGQAAADTAPEQARPILQESLEMMWAGRPYPPQLKQRQQTLKAMLDNGLIKPAELQNLVESAFASIVDRQQTTRYILKTLPERVNDLLSPHMDWMAVKEAMWRTFATAIKKDDPVLIRVGTLAPPGTPWLSVPENIAFPEIERLSDGKVLTKIYGGGVMGEDTDVLRKMDEGQLDCCGCTALGVLDACPEASALLIPRLFNNYEEVDYIYEKFRKTLDEGFERNGNILLALIDTGFFYVFSTVKTTSLDDMRKHKVITWFGAIETTLYQELGITPRPVPVPDTVMALNTGVADTNVAPAAWMLGMQAYQYSNYYLEPPLVYSPAAVLVSARMKDRIQLQTGKSPTYAHNLMEILVYEWGLVEPEWKRQIRSYEEKSLKAFKTKCGMKAVILSPEDQRILEDAGQAVQRKLAGTVFPKDLTNDIKKALSEYRTSH